MSTRAAKKALGAFVAVLACVAAGFAAYDFYGRDDGLLRIYGSIDLRTVNLAFEEAGRIAQVRVEEGMTVKAGEELARLETRRYEIARESAAAQVGVAQKELALLLAGSRTEEIDAARAQLKASQASYELARRTCDRETKLGAATTRMRVDEA